MLVDNKNRLTPDNIGRVECLLTHIYLDIHAGMRGVYFLALAALSTLDMRINLIIFLFLMEHCSHIQADVLPPSFGDVTYVLKGSKVNLTWILSYPSSTIFGERAWEFMKFGQTNKETLAQVIGGNVIKINSSLTDPKAFLPTTLILNNVDLRYNGTYTFSITVVGVGSPKSDVVVIITEKPTAVIQCTEEIPITVNEGDPVSCVCSSTGGVPTPKAWWIKDGVTVSGPTDVSNILNKTMSRNDSGTYTCKVESIPSLSDEKSIQISFYCKISISRILDAPSITFFNESTTVTAGAPITIYCTADGSPQPEYTLYKDGKIILTTSDLVLVYTIDEVNAASHKGEYKCMAKNTLGSDSKTFYLNVTEIAPKTTMPPARDPVSTALTVEGLRWQNFVTKFSTQKCPHRIQQ